MTASQAFAKDLEARNLERQGVADLWRRTWKASTIVAVTNSHARLLSIETALYAKLAGIEGAPGPVGKEWDGTFTALEKVTKALGSVREQMMALGLHPTRPKAGHSTRANRPQAEPVEAVEVSQSVPVPRPEIDGPSEVTP